MVDQGSKETPPALVGEDVRRAELRKQAESVVYGWGRTPRKTLGSLISPGPYEGHFYSAIKFAEEYAMHATQMYGELDKGLETTPLKEVESAVARITEIRGEFEKEQPDLSRMEKILTEFLFARIKHFAETINERLERAGVKPTDDIGRVAWEALREATDWMKEDREPYSVGLKTVALARIGKNLESSVLGMGLGNPFCPDDFSIPAAKIT